MHQLLVFFVNVVHNLSSMSEIIFVLNNLLVFNVRLTNKKILLDFDKFT